MADRSGEQLGNYRLIRLLGQGGFAEVYLAEHLHLKTQVAVKVLHTRVAEENIESFRNEARILARLIHPHIVRVFDFGVDGSIAYLVMDYAPNGTLRKRHPRHSQLPLPTVVEYVKQVASGLQYAHNERLIHRDIKPENLLIGRNNDILLSDFGIALIVQSSRLQSLQDVAGTAAYMAPEQFQGKPRTASDQYALAVVVYEWLRGTLPFQGSFSEIASQHLFVPPPPLEGMVPLINADIEQVVMTAMAKDPKQRFGSVQAFANALEQASRPLLDNSPTVRGERDMLTIPSLGSSIDNAPPQNASAASIPSQLENESGVRDGSLPVQAQERPNSSTQPASFPPSTITENSAQMPRYQMEHTRLLRPPAPPFSSTPFVPYTEPRKGISKRTAGILAALALLVVLSGVFLFTPALTLIMRTTSNGIEQIGNKPQTQLSAVPGVRGGTWTDDVLLQPDSLIPNLGLTESSLMIEQALYSPLFVSKPDGTIVPALATEVPGRANNDASEDLKTWTIKLKPNLKWSDGMPITADDVDFTWKLWTNSKFPGTYTGGFNLITSATVSADKLSITFHLKQPYASFPTLWVDGSNAPLPQHHFASIDPTTLQKSPDNTNPTVVSGPFMISSVSNTQDTLVRNPNYYRASERLPYLDKVIFRFFDTSDTLLKDIEVGNATSTGTPDINNLASYKALSNYTVVTSPVTDYIQVMNFDFKNPILGSDLAVRKAISMAIDRQSLIQMVQHGQGAMLCTDHGTAFHPGYQADARCPTFDAAQAENFLSQDGWTPGNDGIRAKGGQRLQFQYGFPKNLTGESNIAQIIQQNLKAIGIDIILKPVDEGTFYTQADHGNYDMASYELVIGYDAADNQLAQCDQGPPNGFNYGSYCNHTLDSLYAQEQTTDDPATRQQIFNRVHQIYLTDLPFLVLYSPTNPVVANKRVHNYLPEPAGPIETAQIWEWWCDQSTCA